MLFVSKEDFGFFQEVRAWDPVSEWRNPEMNLGFPRLNRALGFGGSIN